MGLDGFFVVTQNSFYLAALDQRGLPYITKLLGRDSGDTQPGNRSVGELLAITATGIFFYHQDYSPFSGPRLRPQRPEEVNLSLWSGGTSPVVALFLDYGDGLACFRQADLQPLDPRWRDDTLRTLAAIGPDNPKFILSNHVKLRFDYPAT